MTKVLLVLSGGQDSTTCLFWAKYRFDKVQPITFDYGQRHHIEITAAMEVAQMAEVEEPIIVNIENVLKSASPLVADTPLEQYLDYKHMDKVIGTRIEKTFVPMRNALFLTIAANYAVALHCEAIVIGICQADNANYPDCTGEFKHAFSNMMHTALGSDAIQVFAPLINCSKADSIRLAQTLPGCMEALAFTHTSYDGRYPPTDKNHSNILRAEGFRQAGVPDPLVVRAWKEGLMDLPETRNYDTERV